MGDKTSIMKALLFFTCNLYLASAATHSLQYFYTAVTSGINFPEFSNVGMLDGVQMDYYDSNIRKVIPKADWMEKVTADDPDYWNRQTQTSLGSQETFKVDMGTLMGRFNQTKGDHTVQWMYGCELDDDGTKRGYYQHGYDGEDFISLDMKTFTWITPKAQAVPTKLKWNGAVAAQRKNYLENICIEWLQKYVAYGRDTLERKVRPEVSLFQKDSSSPVVCHATGFFPKEVMISWRKDGQDLNEDVELREPLVNQDGNYQKRSILKVSPEKLDKHEYACVVEHSSLKQEMVLKVADRRVLSGDSFGIIIGAVVAVLLVALIVAAVAGFVIWKKKKEGFKPVLTNPNAPSEDSGSSHSSELREIRS